MKNISCSTCRTAIPAVDINIAEGVALCRACRRLVPLGDIDEEAGLAPADPAHPPHGCRLSGDGVQVVLRASCRSPAKAAVSFGIAAFWNGIVSVFILLALANTIHHFQGSVPAWFPAPPLGGTAPGSNRLPLILTLVLWVFLIPFVVIGADMLVTLAFALVGRVEVRLNNDRGIVVTALGPLRWWRRFDVGRIEWIVTEKSAWWQEGDDRSVIILKGERPIRFGSMLPRPRRAWMVAVLKERLTKTRRDGGALGEGLAVVQRGYQSEV